MKHILFATLFLSVSFAAAFEFRSDSDGTAFVVVDGDVPVLRYVAKVVAHENVPANDKRREAGCYVHPLYGLNGETLTDNAPRDHFHHHGVFWTWPHVTVHYADSEPVSYDLWQDTQGRIKQHPVRKIARETSDDVAVLNVENGWFVGPPEDGKNVMREVVKITVHRVTEEDGVASRWIDFDFVWTPLVAPITLQGAEGKSYGGFTIRFRPSNKREDNTITTPLGVAKDDLPDTPLAWADYTSRFGAKDNTLSGAAIFVSKTHPDFPPTWLTRYYGPLCVGYPGVKAKTFDVGEDIKLSYRVWIHRGAVTPEQLSHEGEQK
ncbi:MAG: DUF6807 family protein [Thermoguttaceae bacterium]